jgi:hypothetical protein
MFRLTARSFATLACAAGLVAEVLRAPEGEIGPIAVVLGLILVCCGLDQIDHTLKDGFEALEERADLFIEHGTGIELFTEDEE